MANTSPATVTTSLPTGPGQSMSSVKFTDVAKIECDFGANILRIVRTGSGGTVYCDFSAAATITWTISSGISTLSFS